MKKILFFIAFALSIVCVGKAQEVYSIITCAGEDASKSINISWASETEGTYVLFTQKSDKSWEKAKIVKPEQEFLCTTFDSIYSKLPDGSNTYERVKFHKCGAVLNGLKKDTEYKYYICRDGKQLSTQHNFKTAGAKNWSCCVISDFHAYTPLPNRQRAAMQMIETVENYDKNFDWILHLGDVIAWGGSYSFWKSLYAEPFFEKYFWAGLNGNHDNMTRKNGQSADHFRHTNYTPQNGYGDQVGVCYHFRYGDALFVMLNNEAMHKPEGLAEAQKWVKEVITTAKNSQNPPRYTIVCEHYQWFYGGDGRSSHYDRWRELFDELGVDLALAGNNHIYVRTGAVYKGAETDGKSGTVYLQTSSADNERGQKPVAELIHNADIIKARWTEGDKTVSALSLKADAKKLTIKLINRYGTILDTAVIWAK